MKFLQYLLITGLGGIFFLQSGCDNKDKWKAVPLKITKRESFNYSEMISGDLDSTAKAELESAKKMSTEKLEDKPKQKRKLPSEDKKGNSIWRGIQNIYNWFIDLF